jgi:predicted Zn-dependent peptidase
MAMAEDLFEHCLYDDTPAGWDVLGTKENIQKFKQEDFLEYLHSQYGSRNSIVCIVGNLENKESQIGKLVDKDFSQGNFKDWGEKFHNKEKISDQQTGPQVKVKFKETDQAHMCLGVRTYGYGHPDRMTLKLISIILGGSMSSRIWSHLREREGLGYYVSTHSENYTDSGYLMTRAGIKIGEIEKAINIILEEYKKIKNILVDKKELDRTKDLLRGRLALQLETSDNLAEWYGRQAIMDLELARENKQKRKILLPEEFIKAIDKITAKDIRRVAQAVFTENKLNFAVVGPYKDKNFKGLLDLK